MPSEQYRMMPRLGGIVVESCRVEATFPQMKDYIALKYLEWKTTGNVSIQRDERYIGSFSYEKLAETFWNLIGGDNGIHV